MTFADVAGLDEAVEELEEIKDFLAAPARFEELGAKIPKGVLLFGPPGTGKTLLAKAVAGEAGVPFFSISGSDFVEMFVGVGASRVRDLFAKAKAAAPAIVFVDEIDAVGRHRGAGVGGGHDEREQTLNQLLVEMDGFDAKTGVILLASTNRPDILDPALLRPGPLRPPDRRRPSRPRRPQGDPRGARARQAARRRRRPRRSSRGARPGFTGADLANLVNEAALLAGRRGLEQIGVHQLEEAIDRVMAGPERRSRLISDVEKRVIAYHEGGHALVSHALPHTDPVHKVSIIPRGRALGYTLTLPTEDRFLVRRSELVDELAMLLGGRSAEELIFADPTTGAQNDIDRATTIARQMVTEFGMSERLGPDAARPAPGRGVPRPRLHLDARLLRGDRGAHRRRGAGAARRRARRRRRDPRRRTGPRSTGSPPRSSSTRRSKPTRCSEVLGDVEPWTHRPRRAASRPSAVATSDHAATGLRSRRAMVPQREGTPRDRPQSAARRARGRLGAPGRQGAHRARGARDPRGDR